MINTIFASFLLGSVSSPSVDSMPSSSTRFLQRPEGRIAWDLSGSSGPLVVCLPGMGDTRRNWSGFQDSLAARGFRVAVLDIRGHGESDTGFRDVTSRALAEDALALASELDTGKVFLVGNSYCGASVVWAATDHPEKVRGIALLDPFAREIPATFGQNLIMALGMHRPWGPSLWGSYYRSLFVDHKPADLDERVRRLVANMKEPGRFETLKAMAKTSAAECEPRLARVKVPALVLMGSKDPDFPDPRQEAERIATPMHATIEMIEGAGHYPFAERPGQVSDILGRFLSEAAKP